MPAAVRETQPLGQPGLLQWAEAKDWGKTNAMQDFYLLCRTEQVTIAQSRVAEMAQLK